MKTSGIGGQAVMEGVMMRNGSDYAVAVRMPDKTIEVKKDKYKSASSKNAFFRLPIIRGVVTFVDSMVLGMRTLTYSAELVEGGQEEEEPSAFEKFLIKIFKEKAANIVMGLVVFISVLLAVGLFVLLPTFVAGLLGGIIRSATKQTLVEGLIRLALFLLYVWLISLMNDIKRTYMYHGAEHKCINCVENGLDLTVENVRKSSRFHKRCGTSFTFIVVFLSIILFMFIRTDVMVLKVIFRLLLIPVIAGISYEFIRFAGKSESKIVNILSQPGMWLQRITTKEPDDEMIEVGIASVEAVFDWRPFVENVREKAKASSNVSKKEKVSKKDNDAKSDDISDNSNNQGISEDGFVINAEFSDVRETRKKHSNRKSDMFKLDLEDVADENDNYDEGYHLKDDLFELDDLEEIGELEKVDLENDLMEEIGIDKPEDEETDESHVENEFESQITEDASVISEPREAVVEEAVVEEAVVEEPAADAVTNNEELEETIAWKTTENENVEEPVTEPATENEDIAESEDLHEYTEEADEEDEADEADDEDEEDDEPAKNIQGLRGFFGGMRRKKNAPKAREHIARHRTMTDYDEDYDESDELLAELDRMFSEDKKDE